MIKLHHFTGIVIVAQLFVNACLCFSFQSEVTDKLRFTTFYFYFGLVVCELILCCFNEKPPLFSNVDTDPVSKILSVVWLSKFVHTDRVCVCAHWHACMSHIQNKDLTNCLEICSFLSFDLYGLFFCMLLISPQNPCPESTAGFLSTITFWWFTRWVHTVICSCFLQNMYYM